MNAGDLYELVRNLPGPPENQDDGSTLAKLVALIRG